MDLDQREIIIKLYDSYQSLLTAKQKLYFESYYYDDLSLAEIASNCDVSRNAVFDQIKKTISILEKYEDNLHLSKNEDLLNQALSLDNIEEIKKIMSKIIEE